MQFIGKEGNMFGLLLTEQEARLLVYLLGSSNDAATKRAIAERRGYEPDHITERGIHKVDMTSLDNGTLYQALYTMFPKKDDVPF